MIQRQKIITGLVGVLSLCAAVRADMVPLSPVEAEYRPSLQLHIPSDPISMSSSSAFVDFTGLADWGSLPGGLLPEPGAQMGQTSETKHAQILRDGQSSLDLCLCALFGLAASSVKKVRFGGIVDRCYRGPFQIGHGSAISPDCLCSAPVICLIQPDFAGEDYLSQYYRGAIACLLQKSQFTPTALAPRGPPPRCC